MIGLAVSSREAPRDQTGAIGSPQPPPSVPVAASPLPSSALEFGLACGQYVTDSVLPPADLQTMGSLSDAVITATVVKVGDTRWATAEGKPPNDPHLIPTPFDVYRVVQMEVVAIGKLSAGSAILPGSTVEARIPGGTVGCVTLALDYLPSVNAGDEVAVFLEADPDVSFPSAPQADFDVLDVWPIVDGVVRGRGDPMSPGDLLEGSTTAP